jgi:hypothetical protein
MELYTLDPLLRRDKVVDRYESLIWTERYQSYGDFQLDIFSNLESRGLFKAGTLLAMNQSNYVMKVETTEDGANANGEKILSVKGRSLEAILYDRIAKESTSDLTASPSWTITGTPGVIARKIFHDICVTGILDVGDKIPFINEGTFLAAGTVSEPVDPITVEIEPTTVYEAIAQICTTWNLGFRLLRQFDMSKLWFDIYSGSNRTTAQTTLPPVVFAPGLDNLQNTKELTTIEGSKNVAYVFSPAGFKKVYPDDVDPGIAGLERHVLVVNASDIDSTNPDIPAALTQRGKEELAKYRTQQAFDGEINQNSSYKYGVHYNLGDIVETRNSDGVTNNMRVTEQIFVSDKEGERAYPTLTINVFINTGSWLSWLNNKTWADLDPDTTSVWSNQP